MASDVARVKTAVSHGGTDGSNPAPSSSEASANALFLKSVAQFTRHGGWRAYLWLERRSPIRACLMGKNSPSEQRLEGSRKCQIKNDGSMRYSTFSGCRATRPIGISLES